MSPEKVKRLLFEFMRDVYPGSIKDLQNKWEHILEELEEKLSKSLSSKEEVNEYLSDTLQYIDNLNDFFAKKKSGKIPYSKIFIFANKDERLAEFLFSKGLKKKLLEKDSEMAGFSSEGKDECLNMIFKNEVYGFIYSSSAGKKFYFSPAVNRLIVQFSNGEVFSYSEYRRKKQKRKKTYLKMKTLYKKLKGNTNNDIAIMFCKFMDRKFMEENGFRKRKKKSFRA